DDDLVARAHEREHREEVRLAGAGGDHDVLRRALPVKLGDVRACRLQPHAFGVAEAHLEQLLHVPRRFLERERLDARLGEVVLDLVLPDGLHPLHLERRELHTPEDTPAGSRYARRVRRIGHRGAKGHAPDNTIASFQKAIDLACDEVETDVWLMPRGSLVIAHDRPETNDGLLELDQVLDFCRGRMGVNVELKCEGSEAAARETGRRVGAHLARRGDPSVYVSSFWWVALE